MTDITIDFARGPKRVALVVRGKMGPAHHPGAMEQHADAILSDGSPIGFFGEGNDGSLNSAGLGMKGVVYDYAQLRRKRRPYVDLDSAVAYGVVSTVLVIDVTNDQATKFDHYWTYLSGNPGSFNIVGGNCSSNASDSFMAAGILKDSIPWLDTPDNLYQQLTDRKPAGGSQSHTGYLGFNKKDTGGYVLVIRPYKLDPKVNTPDAQARGRSGSLGSGGST